MTVALALCNKNTPGLAGLFSVATRARLVTQWPHAGMVVNGVLTQAQQALIASLEAKARVPEAQPA